MKPESKARMTLVSELQFESGSGSLTSAGPLRTLSPVFRMLLLVFLVLNLVILFAAAADDSGWWSCESDASRSTDGLRDWPRLSRGPKFMAPRGGVPSSPQVRWPQKSRSIASLGESIDHNMRTCLLFPIKIISATGSGSSG